MINASDYNGITFDEERNSKASLVEASRNEQIRVSPLLQWNECHFKENRTNANQKRETLN